MVDIKVRVIPRTSKNEIVGMHDGALKIRIAAPPVDGAANEELIRLLAKTFGIARRDITIAAGETSKTKRVTLDNISPDRVTAMLAVLTGK